MSPDFVKALARARAAFPPIPRNKTVNIRMKSGGSFEYSYAPLDTVLAAVVPALSAEGIAMFQDIREGYLSTHLLYGGEELVLAPIKLSTPDGSPPQDYGSAVTYAQRMSLRVALVIAPDEDNDAKGIEDTSDMGGRRQRPGEGHYADSVIEEWLTDMKALLATSRLPEPVRAAIDAQATDVRAAPPAESLPEPLPEIDGGAQ
jgi:hypothetical protein